MVVSDDSTEYIVEALMSDAVYASLEQRFEAAESGFHHEERHVHVRAVKTADVWQGHDIDIVIDTLTGNPDKETAKQHQAAGAKRVVFAAPCNDVSTVLYGVNDDEIKKAGDALSGGGSERAAAEPVLQLLADELGQEKSLLTTIDGAVCGCHDGECDCNHAEVMSETSTGARLRAPVLLATMTEVVAYVTKPTTAEKLQTILHAAAEQPYYQGILGVSEAAIEPDQVIGESLSALVDLTKISVAGGKLISIKLWYDREWGYANRLVELTADYGKVKQA
jgi:glyceraldehyde-3-phosphate dehydrogenase/erythrose-4-phosphate dehydrogenase